MSNPDHNVELRAIKEILMSISSKQIYIDWDRVHGHDERINIRSLQWGTHVLYDVVARFASSN